jgi:hypothetical protein
MNWNIFKKAKAALLKTNFSEQGRADYLETMQKEAGVVKVQIAKPGERRASAKTVTVLKKGK